MLQLQIPITGQGVSKLPGNCTTNGGEVIESKDYLVKPDGFNIPFDAERIHGISTELAADQGVDLGFVLEEFNIALEKANFVVGQNVEFDLNIMGCEFHRMNVNSPLLDKRVLDTCTETTANLCQLPGGRGGRFKLPTLTELHEHLFNEPFAEAHNATADVEATTRCFFELIRIQNFEASQFDLEEGYLDEFSSKNPAPFKLIGLQHLNLKEESAKLKASVEQKKGPSKAELNANLQALEGTTFSHLHNHSQFSILQSTTGIKQLVKKAIDLKSDGVALTDTGNMMAAFHFVREALNHNKSVEAKQKEAAENGEAYDGKPIIPIVGCEFNVCRNHLDKSNKDNGYQVVMLAKNKNGYLNLAKMSSIAFTKGFYYVPRIDRSVIEEYKEDVIVLTGGVYGEIPNLILNVGEKQAEDALLWWKSQFGDDLYIELIRHNIEAEDKINEVLLQFAEKHSIELVATNNTFYIEKQDAEAHDIFTLHQGRRIKVYTKRERKRF